MEYIVRTEGVHGSFFSVVEAESREEAIRAKAGSPSIGRNRVSGVSAHPVGNGSLRGSVILDASLERVPVEETRIVYEDKVIIHS